MLNFYWSRQFYELRQTSCGCQAVNMNDIVHHDYSIMFVASPSAKALQFNYTSNASLINFTQNDTWSKTVAELWSVYCKDQVIRRLEMADNFAHGGWPRLCGISIGTISELLHRLKIFMHLLSYWTCYKWMNDLF